MRSTPPACDGDGLSAARAVGRFRHRRGVRQEGLALRGQGHRARGAVEQAHAQFVLKGGDAARHLHRPHAELAARRRQAAAGRHCKENTQVGCLHAGSL
jgi:hypothetical protein